MTTGLDSLKHVVVVMMSGRSFDHMLGGLKASDNRINGLTGRESNPDSRGEEVYVRPKAQFQGQLDPAPDAHFPGVHLQIFAGTSPTNNRVASMQGFVSSYFSQHRNVDQSHNVMYYFSPEKLPVLTTLAKSFAVFNGWFSSVPGPAVCNHAFAHYGTSFGWVGADSPYQQISISNIFERLINVGSTGKLYVFNLASPSRTPPTMAPSLLKEHPRFFGTYAQFLNDCRKGTLPNYSFVEPNHVDHEGEGGEALASDQYPDHNIQQGEIFIASVYNAIRMNPSLWTSSALLITYDHHGGLYDHVPPPECVPDGFIASAANTGIGEPFRFDRLGVRVPAILVSPWVAQGTVVSGPEDPGAGSVFEHASIPATVTDHFLKTYDRRTEREKRANKFLSVLTDRIRPDSECPVFHF